MRVPNVVLHMILTTTICLAAISIPLFIVAGGLLLASPHSEQLSMCPPDTIQIISSHDQIVPRCLTKNFTLLNQIPSGVVMRETVMFKNGVITLIGAVSSFALSCVCVIFTVYIEYRRNHDVAVVDDKQYKLVSSD